MNTKDLHRDYAIQFLRTYAFMAYVGFVASITAIGFLLYKENVQQVLIWASGLYLLETASFGLRYFNRAIFKTTQMREWFGRLMNFIDGLALSSCLLFILDVSIATTAFMNTAMLLLCAGSAMTSAGYRPLLWAFSGSVLLIQLLIYSVYYFNTQNYFYGALAFATLFSFYLVHEIAKNTREGLSEQINVQRANQSKTRFFAASTHDLRQPLAASAALLRMLMLKNKEDELQPLIKQSLEAVNMVDRQISPMMELARIDSGQLQVNVRKFNLAESINNLLPLFESRLDENVRLITDIKVESAEIFSDENLVKRVISNVIDNSIKYTTKGSITVGLMNSNNAYIVKISDTGIGINESELDLIMDEFYQVDNPDKDPRKGFGLGLPIVQRICANLDIMLVIHSEVGSFTEVVLTLPIESN